MWRVATLLGCSTFVGETDAKVMMGIAQGTDHVVVTDFCFGIVGAEQGSVRAQTIVAEPGHKFIIIAETDYYTHRGTCENLEKNAKVVEQLTEKNHQVVAYDLTLKVDKAVSQVPLLAMIVRCGGAIDAQYILDFQNPGGMFTRCFSCNDQGLYERYCIIFLLVLVLAPFVLKAWRIVENRSAINDVTAIAYASLMFFLAHIFCFFLHIMVYAGNGHGVGVLVFFAQFVDFMFSSLFFTAANLMVHGVYITKPSFPQGEERQRYLVSTFVFVCTNLCAAVMTGFMISGAELSPFALYHKAYALPYIIARFLCGGWLITRAMETARAAQNQEKKQVLTRMGFVFGAWCLLIPVFTMMTSEGSWHFVCVRLEIINLIAVLEMFYHLWPGRVGWVFSDAKPSQAQGGMHPYSEFGPREV